MLSYTEPLYRPPSEAASLILQVTNGCSFNRCSFCSMYRDKPFFEKPLSRVLAEIDDAAARFPGVRRVFLADGDALVRPCDDLAAILERLHRAFPMLERVSSYALPLNLLRKTGAELERLCRHGLTLLYYGIESGSGEILRRITKGATPRSMVEGLEKARRAGMRVSATVVLGLGGRELWREHIDGTVALVNRLRLDYLATLQLRLEPERREPFRRAFERRGGRFVPQDDAGMLAELARLVAGLAPAAPLEFRSNHASNALALKGVLPRDRELLLARIEAATADDSLLRRAWVHGL